MVRKSISKSVRMTEEVYGTVMAMRGSGFNEKFENMVLLLQDRWPELEEAERLLQEKRLELCRLMDQYRHLDDFYRMYEDMSDRLRIMRRKLEKAAAAGETKSVE